MISRKMSKSSGVIGGPCREHVNVVDGRCTWCKQPVLSSATRPAGAAPAQGAQTQVREITTMANQYVATTLDQLIEYLELLRKDYGGDTEVCAPSVGKKYPVTVSYSEYFESIIVTK